MALSAATQRALPSTGSSSRDDFLHELGASLPALRREVAAIAFDSDDKGRLAVVERLRKLGATAATLKQALLAEELGICTAILQGAGVLGVFDDGSRADLDGALDRIETYVAAEAEREEEDAGAHSAHRASSPPRRRRGKGTLLATFVGGQLVAESLLAEDWASEDDAPVLQIRRLLDSADALRDIRQRKPDLVVIDTDVEGAQRLVESLICDPETDSLPILALGRWETAEQAAPYIALGVARTLTKPVPPAALRAACLEVSPNRGSGFTRLGELTLDGLGTRLTDELQRGLCDAADHRVRRKLVDLGDGAEVLTVLWEAIARIRELVTSKSRGTVRFSPTGPVEALPKASWLTSSARRPQGRRSSPLNEVREGPGSAPLQGYDIVVAEDDLSTNWFLSGVLKQAGATVHSAFDGHSALDFAYRELPDLVLCDVVMPSLDGFQLCRAIKRDVLLRSVPVILLSWKDDLLQRMRELGAGADGYMRKETSASEILQRVHEVVRPRRVVRDRIASGGNVRGRLDGLTAPALLKIVCQARADSALTLRDANYVYEIQVRGGRPVMATRTHSSGSSERGAAVVASLLGVGAGRFGVVSTPEGQAFSAELEGTLEEQLLEPIARIRAAQSLLSGHRLVRIERVILDERRMAVQLRATPEPSRGLLRALIAGVSPRELISGGRASADLVERVVCDAARQGAVLSVFGVQGYDLLPDAVEREVAVLSGEADEETVRASRAAIATSAMGAEVSLVLESEMAAYDMDDDDPLEVSSSGPVEVLSEQDDDLPQASWSDDDEPSADDDWSEDEDELMSALVGEQDDGLPGPLGRASRPPARAGETPVLASAMEVAEHARQHTPILSQVARRAPQFASLEESRDTPERPAEHADRRSDRSARAREQADGRASDRGERHDDRDRQAPAEEARPALRSQPADQEPQLPRLPMPSAWATRSPEPPPPPKSSARFLLPIMFGVIGIGLAIGARWYREQQPMGPTLMTPPPIQAPLPPNTVEQPMPQSPEQVAAPTSTAELPVELPLSEEDAAKLQDGHGMLEVVVGRNDEVLVNGELAGKGPVVKVALKAQSEPYEVRTKMRGEERVRYIIVKAGKRLRLRVAPPWSR